MRTACICIGLLLLAATPRTVAQAPTVHRTLHVILVEPVGETFTPDEQAAALAGVQRAAQFWETLSPITTSLELAAPVLITSTESMTGSLEWSRPYFADSADVTLFVIDSPGPLAGDALAQSQTPLGVIWVVRGDGPGFEATLAHELGHVLYNLPHDYAATYDIMGLAPIGAYVRPAIGCASLAHLGKVCPRVYLPLLVR